MMDTNKSYFTQFVGILLFASFLLFACSSEPSSFAKQQLHLQASTTEVHAGDNVSFEVMANGRAVDADIYIDGEQANDSTYTFSEAGSHTVIAKREGYTNSNRIYIDVRAFEASWIKSIYVAEDDVYISGYIPSFLASARSIPVYWKNESFHELNFAPAEASSIYISNGDVYIACWYAYPRNSNSAFYLKNENFHELKSSGVAKYIQMYNNDVYVTGFDNIYNYDKPIIATYWKNGTPHKLTDGRGISAKSIYFSMGDVYVAGTKKIFNSKSIDFYWKNETRHILSISGVAEDMDVSEGNVYLAGYKMVDSVAVAAYWKNGTLHKLSDGRANFINITGGNVYVAGWRCDEAHCIVKYWKNGARVSKFQISGSPALSRSFISDGDVYVVGTMGDKLYYWKNGSPHKLEDIN